MNIIPILSILLIWLSLSQVYAQSFIDASNSWTVSERVYNGNQLLAPSTLRFRFHGDSVINNLNFSKMEASTNGGSWGFHSFWREDVLGNIFYKRGRTNEYLLYNFKLRQGDTINIGNHEVIVDSTVMKFFGNSERKHLYAHYSTVPNHTILWIDGVGSLLAPYLNDAFYLVGGVYSLICYGNENKQVYLNPMYTDCDALSGLNVNESGQGTLIDLYPIGNGAIRYRRGKGCIHFFTLEGRLLKSCHISSVEDIICLSNSGLFFYRYVSIDNKIQTGKIMVR
jgi:hypothetical protein